MRKALRVGLIGCGGIGALRAAAIRKVASMKLVAVSDLARQRAEEVAGRDTAIVDDWRDLIGRADVDAVIISTPPSLHAEMGIAAADAGKHILCEKPLARDAAESRAIVEAARTAGVVAATGFNYRYYPSVTRARELLEAGRIGEVDHIRSYSGYSATDHSHEWLHDAAVMGGGALRDNGIHLLDLTCHLLGDEVVEATGMLSGRVWGFDGCEDNGYLLLRSGKGRIATVQASWTEWRGYEFRLEIHGTRGVIEVSCFPMITKAVWSDDRGGRTRSRRWLFPLVHLNEHLRSYRWVVTQSFVLELEAFAGRVHGDGDDVLATAADGALTVELAEAAGPDGPGGGTEGRLPGPEARSETAP